LKRIEVVVEDLSSTSSDAIAIIPGTVLPGGVDLSDFVLSAAGITDVPTCAPGEMIKLPGGKLTTKQILYSPGIAWVDGSGREVPTLVSCYRVCLEAAEKSGFQTLDFPSVPTGTYKSQMFQVITMLWGVIISFQAQHAMPEKVRIVCQNEEAATLYRQVYNFYYPGQKSDRMQDAGWD